MKCSCKEYSGYNKPISELTILFFAEKIREDERVIGSLIFADTRDEAIEIFENGFGYTPTYINRVDKEYGIVLTRELTRALR